MLFLRTLRWHIGGRILVVWDGSPIHKREVRAFLAADGAKDFLIEAMPPYAPDRNPLDAGFWHLLKGVELRNVCCKDLSELRHESTCAIRRLRRQPQSLQSCFAGAGLSITD